jgi:hypothetical protein
MRFRLPHVFLGIFAACALAVPGAHAFTIENKDAGGAYGVPKFDVEEQARNFRKGGADTTPGGKNEYETPVGKLQFGVQQGSRFGAPFGSGFGPTMRNSRQDMDRMLAPPTSLDYGAR